MNETSSRRIVVVEPRRDYERGKRAPATHGRARRTDQRKEEKPVPHRSNPVVLYSLYAFFLTS